jgi:hypothetical protein
MLGFANALLLTSSSPFGEADQSKKLYLNKKKYERC